MSQQVYYITERLKPERTNIMVFNFSFNGIVPPISIYKKLAKCFFKTWRRTLKYTGIARVDGSKYFSNPVPTPKE